MRRALLGSIVLSISGGLLLTAQQPTFRARVDHVTLDAVITDKDEHPIVGLTAADFEISEHDKKQTISDFTYVSIPPRTIPIDIDAPPQPPRDVAMNARSTERSRAIVILINEASILPQEIEQTRKVVAELIRGLSSDDQAAVSYMRCSRCGQDFTNDPDRLAAAVNRMREAQTAAGTTNRRESEEHFSIDNAAASLAAATQPRKVLIYVAERGVVPKYWTGTFEKLKRAGLPVYPIDPVATEVFQPVMRSHFEEPRTFVVMAQDTGGHDLLHPEDPVATAADLMAENGSYYLLGYYPSPFERDGKFHDVKVRVPSRPGAHIRVRQGYVASSDKPAPSPERSMTSSLGAGLDDPGLPIQIFATPMAPSGPAVDKGHKGLMRTLITTTVLYPPVDGAAGKLDDELRVGIVAFDEDGHVEGEHQRVVPLKGGGSAGTLTLVVDDAIDLPPKNLTIRVGVSSQARGTTGTSHLMVQMPDLRKSTIALGGVAIGFATPGALILNPAAITGLVPFHPTTAREFSAADTIRVFSRVFWPPTSGTSLEVTTRVADSPITKTVALTGTPEGDHLTGTLDTQLPLGGLSSGTHVIDVEVKGPSQSAVSRHVVIDIR
jgi:VWFA-related protein